MMATDSGKHSSDGELKLSKRVRLAADELKSKNYATNPEFFRLLLCTTVDRFFEKDAVIFVAERKDKLLDVWKGLIEHGFLSVPVLQKTEQRYYGCLDLADIVRVVVNTFSKEARKGEEKFWSEMTEAKAFVDETVDDVMKYPISKRNPFHPVRKGYSLLTACELLAREPELHRVPIVTDEGQLCNFITQSKLIQFINDNRDLVGDKLNKPLSECRSFFKDVVAVDQDVPAFDAFNIILDKHISAVAVVDSNKQLIGGLSVRDLRELRVQGPYLRSFWRFFGSAENFVKCLHSQNSGGKTVLYHTTPNATLGDVLGMLATHNIHRLFIVESEKNRELRGVVSLKDILAEILTC